MHGDRVPSWSGTRSHMPQRRLKIPHAATKTQNSQINKIIKPSNSIFLWTVSFFLLPERTTATLPPHPLSCIFTAHSTFPLLSGVTSHVPICWASFFSPMHILIFFFFTYSRNWSPVGPGSQERNVTSPKAGIGQLSFLFLKPLQGFERK